MVFVVGALTTNEVTLPTFTSWAEPNRPQGMVGLRPTIPLPAVQAASTKILPKKCLNNYIAEPRIFCPPKITRYIIQYILLCIYTLQ